MVNTMILHDYGLGTEPSLAHLDITKRAHPDALRPLLPEIEAFQRHNHFNILHPIMKYDCLSFVL